MYVIGGMTKTGDWCKDKKDGIGERTNIWDWWTNKNMGFMKEQKVWIGGRIKYGID